MKVLQQICQKYISFFMRSKKKILFQEISCVKIFYHPPAHIVKCVSEYIFLISKKHKTTRRHKAKKTKEKKRIFVENLMGCNHIYASLHCELLT